jgi:cell wall-associated NlpC family hydrolase
MEAEQRAVGWLTAGGRQPRLPDDPSRLTVWPWLKVSRFEYSSEDDRHATVRLLGILRSGIHAPSSAQLVVRRGGTVSTYDPAAFSVHRRAGNKHRGSEPGLLWTVSFELPLTVVEYPRTSFEVVTPERSAVELPLPHPKLLASPGIESNPLFVDARRVRIEPLVRREHITALASVLAFGGGLSSAVAVATADSSTTPASTGTSTATTTTSTDTSTSTETTTDTTTEPTTDTTTTDTTSTTTDTSTTTEPATTAAPATTTAPASTTTTAATTTAATTPSTTTAPATTTISSTSPTPATGATGATGTTGIGATILPAAGIGSGALSVAGSITENGKSRKNECESSTSKHAQKATKQEKTSTKSRKTLVCAPAKKAKKHKQSKPAKPGSTTTPDGGTGLQKQTPAPTTFKELGPGTGSPWAGELTNPLTGAELRFYQSLVSTINKPPKFLRPIYQEAGKRFKLPWQVLAAINAIETDYGRDLAISSKGAEGWMQFEPGTWSEYGMAVSLKGKILKHAIPNPYSPSDAIFAAARYLKASGGQTNMAKAVFSYNHAKWYVTEVLSLAEQINRKGIKAKTSAHRKIYVMQTMARLLNGLPYVWGGGHSTWVIDGGYDCSGFISAVLHSAGFVRFPQTTQTLPFVPKMMLGKGRWVTVYDRTDGASTEADHVIIDLKGQWWESGGSGLNGGAARVHRIKRKNISKTYLASFNLLLHPKGL